MKNFLIKIFQAIIFFTLIVFIIPNIYKFSMAGQGFFVITRFLGSFFLLFIIAFVGSLAFE